MEAEERQQRKREKKRVAGAQLQQQLEEQLATSVPAAPLLADFDLTAVDSCSLPRNDVDVTVERQSEDNAEQLRTQPLEHKDEDTREELEEGNAGVEVVEADFAELGRGLHRLEPNYFLSKVSENSKR